MRALKLLDLEPDQDTFHREVVEGLSRSPKSIPCKFFYDEKGSKLFEEICGLEEYYLTRTEIAILVDHAPEMGRMLGERCLLVEYGSGAGLKTRLVLDELVNPVGYVPIDISKEQLLASARALQERYSELPIHPVCADYTEEFEIPETARRPEHRAVFFPGSTLGNFEPERSREFLRDVASVCGRGGALLIGIDLKKDRRILERAYNDARGVTAAFNRNLLARINRELGADFALDRFRHEARYDESAGRIEMHLVSTAPQTVHVDGEAISFESGESIWTESSYKYGIEEFRDLARSAGFEVERIWTDEEEMFSVQLLRVPPGPRLLG
jgi:dimethylhistidine N-methyltransferase